MITKTYDDFVAALEAAVNEKGEDYRYSRPPGFPLKEGISCYYVHEDEPGCLIGNALHRLGVPLSDFRAVEGKNAQEVLRKFARPNEVWSVISFGPDQENVENLAREVQRRQDRGDSWGDSLTRGRTYLGDITRV